MSGEGAAREAAGLDAVPEEDRPTNAQVNIVHLAWDVMVGLATLLFLVSLYYGGHWLIRRRMPDDAAATAIRSMKRLSPRRS